MDLTTLSKDDLQEEFLRINHLYISITGNKLKDYIDDPMFLKIREDLRNVLNELQRRREIKSK